MTKDLPTIDAAETERRKRRREALLLLLLIGTDDIERAKEWWEGTGLQHPDLLTDNRWEFDPQRQLYVGPHNHKITGDDMKRISLGLSGESAEQDMRHVSSRVARQAMPIERWQAEMATLTKNVYLTQSALAAGGFNALKPSDLERVSGHSTADNPSLTFTFDKLADFGDAIEDNEPRADSEAAITSRAALYAASSNGVYEEQRRASHGDATGDDGKALWLFEKNILGDAEHCRDSEHTVGCVTVTEAGWQPIGTLPKIGTRSCLANCRCTLVFSLDGKEPANN